MSLWTEKYKPTKIKQLVGNKRAINLAVQWINKYKEGLTDKRALFISGPPGIGKTTFAQILLKDKKYNLIEFNASDVRNQKLVKEKLENIIGKISITSIMGGHKYTGIIMDEVDGMSSGDRGGISELINIINPNKGKRKKDKITLPFTNPIICICNNESDKKMKDLKKECECIQFVLPRLSEIYEFSEQIIEKENIKISEDDLLKIVTHSQNDIRKTISMLEYISKGNKLNNFTIKDNSEKSKSNKKSKGSDESNITNTINSLNSEKIEISNIDDVLLSIDKKNEDKHLFKSIYEILEEYKGYEQSLQLYNTDRNLVSMLVHENILSILDNYKGIKKEKMKVMERIYELLSYGDHYNAYLFTNNDYQLGEGCGIISCAGPSYLLNQLDKTSVKKFQSHEIVFSKLLSKFSMQYQNYKTNIYINKKLNLFNSYKTNFILLNTIIKQIVINVNNRKAGNYIEYDIKELISNNDLTIDEFEKILKLIIIKYKKTKHENTFKILAQCEVDKKYIQKYLKTI